MKRWPYRWTPPSSTQPSRKRRWQPVHRLLLLSGAGLLLALALVTVRGPLPVAIAQDNGLEQQENQLIREFSLPSEAPPAPVFRPAPAPAPAPEPAPPPEPEPAPAPEPIRRPAAPEPAPPPEPEPVEPMRSERSEPTAPESDTTPAPADTSPDTSPETPAGTEETRPTTTVGTRPSPRITGPLSRYIMEFNRNPVVGNRLRLQGTLAETGLGFTRPRAWNVQSIRAIIRYQHSPALLAKRSNLTVRVNGTSIGSVPLARKDGQIGEYAVTIRPDLLQDFNNISVFVQQNNDPNCSNPADPTLWTEVLPDSKLIFNYQPASVPLDFKNFPFPFFDTLALGESGVAYALPTQIGEDWLTSVAQFQAGMGRLADFRPFTTNVVKSPSELNWNEGLVVVGTPAEQPLLSALKLPFRVAANKVQDGSKTALPDEVGVLMLTTTANGRHPVLIATGNGPEGVKRAVNALMQPKSRQIGTGQAILVNDLPSVASPEPRDWPRHLPQENRFKLSDRLRPEGEPYKDITVRGSAVAPIDIPFRALPDDRFLRGNTMNLVYSYGPQMNTRTSTVEVQIDGIAIAGKRLTSDKGASKERMVVNLPENLIKPNSQVRVRFQLNPRDATRCGVVPDQQLWATLHAETNFELKRQISAELPSLELLQSGYPFAAPQDLSSTAIVVPDSPSNADVLNLLEISERLGRASRSDGIQLTAHTAGTLSEEVRRQKNLIGIGIRDKFPLPEVLDKGKFNLGNLLTRRLQGQATLQTLPDRGAVIKTMISPWNNQRVILALTGQNDQGLKSLQGIFENDSWFLRLKGDTVLVSANESAQASFDPDAYQLTILQEQSKKRLEKTDFLSKASRFIQENWIALPTAVVSLCLLLYGVSQLLLKRAAGGKS